MLIELAQIKRFFHLHLLLDFVIIPIKPTKISKGMNSFIISFPEGIFCPDLTNDHYPP